MKWDNFEKEVRKFASIRWSRPCYKETIIGIEIDGVLRLDENHYKLIQITQNEKLEKFRKDIGDLEVVRNELFHKNYISSDLYIITEEEISSRMLETATAKRVSALTFLSFKNEFFNYESYKYERGRKPFGSAVIPETGEQENNNFIQVDYINSLDNTHITFGELVKHLAHGKKIILKGEYGTGKSRLIQALFFDLIKKLNNEYVLAIDLRDYKGVISDEELIRRHMSKFGLAENADNCIKCLNNGSFIFLIDGFDEIAVQSWSENPQKLVDIRFRELSFLRNIIQTTKKGILITGREHFFNDDKEMIKAFGLKKNDFIILESKGEFTTDEIKKFKTENNINIEIPEWYPKKPMAVRLLINNELTEDIIAALKINNPYFFWKTFFEYITERDVKANTNVLETGAIQMLLLAIAKFTRNTNQNNGPISMEDLNKIFKEVIGYDAVDESSAYLQRLPGIGRVASDSYDRNFTDDYFLDFLRVHEIISEYKQSSFDLSDNPWKNILSRRGIELLSNAIMENDIELSDIIGKLIRVNNKTMLIEFIAAGLLSTEEKEIDFRNILINNVSCSHLNFFEKIIKNIKFENSIIYNLDITNCKMINVMFSQSIINKLYGVSSRKGIDTYFDKTCDIEEFEQISSIAKIKQVKLSPAQQYLVLIMQKVFNQKGSGRKEEVLTRGFHGIHDVKLAKKILNYLEKENVLSTHLGDEGKVYTGNKKYQPRIEKILEDLTLSKDEIWKKVNKFE